MFLAIPQALIFLDLFAAFDIIDHSTLILSSLLMVWDCSMTLQWFISYLAYNYQESRSVLLFLICESCCMACHRI